MNEDLELVSGIVTVNVRHEFTADELAKESQQLAKAIQDKATVDNNKKVATSGFNNQIKILDGEIKKHSDNVTNGFTYKDVTAELFRDYNRQKRVYMLKGTDMIIKEEDFRESDHQKIIDFDSEERELTEIDRARQQQVEENNAAGAYAEGVSDSAGLYIGNDGNLTDIKPATVNSFDALDKVISDKKKPGKSKEKPTPKNLLGDHYNKLAEFQEDEGDDALPDKDDLFKPTE